MLSSGPPLLTVRVNVIGSSISVTPGGVLMSTLMSAALASTVVSSVAVSLSGVGSTSLPLTVTSLVIGYDTKGPITIPVGATTSVTVAVPLTARSPIVQLSTPWPSGCASHCPVSVDTDWNPAPISGNVSTNVTPVAGSGPLLLTMIVYVTVEPSITGSGESVMVTARSAVGAPASTIVVTSVSLLLPLAGSGSLAVTLN